MARGKKVFVTQENKFNFVPAEKFGEVIFLTREEFSPMSNSLRNEKIVSDIKSNLSDYIPGYDYLIPAGSPVCIGLAFVYASKQGDAINILQWSNQEREYRPITINI